MKMCDLTCIQAIMWKRQMYAKTPWHTVKHRFLTFKLSVLTLALGALGLSACSSVPTPPPVNKRVTMVTPQVQQPLDRLQQTIQQQKQQQAETPPTTSAFLGADDIDTESLNRLEELLYATDIRAVEGDRLLILKHGDVWKRLTVGYRMKLDNKQHSRISAQRNWFVSRQPYLDRLSARASRYLFYTVREAERRGMPTELALLPIIESSYDPAATSSAAAAGLWQFIPSTGKAYGLNQTATYDGRRDVVASTQAAYDFLGSLYNQFGSWELALAAYNAGPGTVSKAIKQNQVAGLPTDYWSLRLPRETMDYVPRFIAVAQIVKNPSAYDVSLPPIANRPHFREVQLTKPTNLNDVADVTGLDRAELYALNPGYRGDMIDHSSSMRILLPADLNPNIDAQLISGRSGGFLAGKPAERYVPPESSYQPVDKSAINARNQTVDTAQNNDTFPNLVPLPNLQSQQTEQQNTPAQRANQMLPVQQTVSTSKREQELANMLQDEAVYRVATAIPMPVAPMITPDNTISTVTGVIAPPKPSMIDDLGIVRNPSRANVDLNSLDTSVSIAEKTGKEVTKTFSYPTAVVDKTPANSEVARLNKNKEISRQKDEIVVTVPKGKRMTYTVKAGDSLIGIANRHGLNWRDIAEWNKIDPVAPLYVDSTLYLYDAKAGSANTNVSSSTNNVQRPNSYTVQSGDSLIGIARKFSLTTQQLADYNGLTVNSNVNIGQKLSLVPTRHSSTSQNTQTASTANVNKSSNANTTTNRPRIATQVYTVQRGENLTMLANRHGMSPQDFASLTSGIDANTMLQAGQKINVPKQANAPVEQPKKTQQPETHTVKAGESLTSIAQKYHLQLTYLSALNGLDRNSQVQVGQVLKLTGDVPKPKTAPVKVEEKKPAPTPVVKATGKNQLYTVQSGESWHSIARREGISANELASLNKLTLNQGLQAGQKIVIPKKYTDYTVQRGDTLTGIARKYGISTEELARINNISSNANVNLGTTIRVPNR